VDFLLPFGALTTGTNPRGVGDVPVLSTKARSMTRIQGLTNQTRVIVLRQESIAEGRIVTAPTGGGTTFKPVIGSILMIKYFPKSSIILAIAERRAICFTNGLMSVFCGASRVLHGNILDGLMTTAIWIRRPHTDLIPHRGGPLGRTTMTIIAC
jgi:hypothetical protein